MTATSPSPAAATGSTCRLCGGAARTLRPFGASPVVLRCAACDTEMLSPLPTMKQLEDYYTGYATTRTSEERCRELLAVADEAMEHYLLAIGRAPRSARGLSFLDIGFGNGVSLISAVRRGLSGVGVDMDPENVEAAQKLAEKLGVHPTFLHGTLESLQGCGRTFELVKASHVIEHVLDPRAFLADAARLQPLGGHLVLECPNNQALFWRVKNALRRPFKRESFYNSLKVGEHLWGFSRKGLARLLEGVGYEVVSCRDYSVADAAMQPEVKFWYLTFEEGLRRTLKTRRLYPVLNALIREFDLNASRFFSAGMGLSAIARKVRSL